MAKNRPLPRLDSDNRYGQSRNGYREIAAVLFAWVRDGRYQPGQQIPSESELCAVFEVTRVTIRRALALVIQDGALESRQGAGTFVPVTYKPRQPNFDVKLIGPLRGTWQDGDVFEYLGSVKRKATKSDQDIFGTDVKTIEEFGYLRLRQGTPVDYTVFEYADWATALIEDRNEAVMLHLGPYLKERGLSLGKSQQAIGATKANAQLSEILKVAIDDALVRVRSLAWDERGRMYLRNTSYHRADSYELNLEVTVRNARQLRAVT